MELIQRVLGQVELREQMAAGRSRKRVGGLVYRRSGTDHGFKRLTQNRRVGIGGKEPDVIAQIGMLTLLLERYQGLRYHRTGPGVEYIHR